jgi:CRP-like cAMP-binding protein
MEDKIKEFILKNRDHLILFNLLNGEELENILSYLEVINFPAGDIVFNEGDIGDYMGIILSGKLDVKKQTEFKGRQVIIASLKEGSFVGEMSLVNEHEPRSATVSASEDSQIVILKREALESLIQKYPYIGVKILKGLNQVLAIRLRKTVERMTSMF